MSIWSVLLQAVVQGLTEFLPVSSSGHLALVQHFTHTTGAQNAFLSVVLHLGTLVAVFIAFRRTIGRLIAEFFRMLGELFTGKFRWKEMGEYRRMLLLLAAAILPLFLLLPFYDELNRLVGQPNLLFLGICFLLTSVLLYLADCCVKGRKTGKTMRWRDALAVGVTQCVATLPGISRSGSTVSASLLCGLSQKFSLQFSFILGIPAILGAGVLEAKDALANPESALTSAMILPAILGFVVAAAVGLFAIRLVNRLLKRKKFKLFAYYTLGLGAVTLGLGIYEMFVR